MAHETSLASDNTINTLPEELILKICQYLTLPDLLQFAATNKQHRKQVFNFLSDQCFLKKQLGFYHPLRNAVPASENMANPNQPHWPLLLWEAWRNEAKPTSPLRLAIASGAPEKMMEGLQATTGPHQHYPETPAAISQSILALDDEAQTREALWLLGKTLPSGHPLMDSYGPQGDDRLATRVIQNTSHPFSLLQRLTQHNCVPLIKIMLSQTAESQKEEWLLRAKSWWIPIKSAMTSDTVTTLWAALSGEVRIEYLTSNTQRYRTIPLSTKIIPLRSRDREDSLQSLLLELTHLPELESTISLSWLIERSWQCMYDSFEVIFNDAAFFQDFMTQMNTPHPRTNATEENTTAWYWWLHATYGTELLFCLLRATGFLQKLMRDNRLFTGFIEAMSARRIQAAGAYENHSAWQRLVQSDAGITLFLYLLKAPGFMEKLISNDALYRGFMEAMSARRKKTPTECVGGSGWYKLSFSRKAFDLWPNRIQAFLLLLNTSGFTQKLVANSALLKSFIEAMNELQTFAGEENLSAWYWLACSQKGIETFWLLLKIPNFVATLMGDDNLFRGFTEAVTAVPTNVSTNKSAWSRLGLTDENDQASTSQPSQSSPAFWQQHSASTPTREGPLTTFIQAVNERIRENTSAATGEHHLHQPR